MVKKRLGLKTILALNVAIFSAVAVLHFIRLVMGAQVLVNGFELPVWFSGLALFTLAFVAWQNCVWMRQEG